MDSNRFNQSRATPPAPARDIRPASASEAESDAVAVSNPIAAPIDDTPPPPTRTISIVADEFDKAIINLEDLSRSGDIFYQNWLLANEAQLRHRAAREHAELIANAAKEVSRLESELAAATTLLSRRLSAVRSSIL